MPQPKYQKILLKISGEALQGKEKFGISADTLKTISKEIVEVHSLGVEIALVIGGGNIFRGIEGTATGMDRSAADYMGMLATVINSLALQDALEAEGILTRVQTALEIRQVAEPYIRRRGHKALGKGQGGYFCSRHGKSFFHH